MAAAGRLSHTHRTLHTGVAAWVTRSWETGFCPRRPAIVTVASLPCPRLLTCLEQWYSESAIIIIDHHSYAGCTHIVHLALYLVYCSLWQQTAWGVTMT